MQKPSKITLEQFETSFEDYFDVGWLKWVGDELVGIAKDGTEVSIGNKYLNPVNKKWYGLDEAIEYLIHCPAPEDW